MIIQLISILVIMIILGFFLTWLDYIFLKNIYLKNEKFDFNICCGTTSCDGINADVVKKNVPRFVLIKDIYKLPFKNKQFKNTICSHTIEHVEDPIRFFKELERVSKNVVILIPPLWDLGGMINIFEHKQQFLTFKSKHKNSLPKFFKLPLSKIIQDKFGQNVEGVFSFLSRTKK